MYCPNCNKKYDGKFCPECGTTLVEKPVPPTAGGTGINVNLGDANAICGGVHLKDSHNTLNIDNSVHNIHNVNTTVNNITQVAAQKTEQEVLQEQKLLFLNACRRACEDMTLDQDDVNKLDEYRLEIGLDEKTADEIIQHVKDTAVKSVVKTELDTLSKVLLKQFNANLKKNRVSALEKQLEYVETMARKYANEEVQYKFYLALATLRSDQCVKRYEDLQGENYWQTFWSYVAYLKEGKPQEAESLLIDMDKYAGYPTDNTIALGGAGALVKGYDDEAQAYLGEMTGDYTPMLQRFVESIYLVSGLKTEEDLGGEADDCYYYLTHLYGREPQPQSEQVEQHLQTETTETINVSYYIALNGQPYGPCDMTQLSQLKEQSTLIPDTYVWHEGMQNWEFAKERDDLTSLFEVKQKQELEGNFFSGIEIPVNMLDMLILEGDSKFIRSAKKMWDLGYNEAKALVDLCEEYYKNHKKWPDGHVTEFREIPVEEVPNNLLDVLVVKGYFSFVSAVKEKWNLASKEADKLEELCRNYYREKKHWPDGHITEVPEIRDVPIEDVPDELLDMIVLQKGLMSFTIAAQERLNLNSDEIFNLYYKCSSYYEKYKKWPNGHVTPIRTIPIEDIPNELLDLVITDSYEFKEQAKEKWNLSKRETEDLYDSCKKYYKENKMWPDGHVTIKRVVRIEDIPNDILDMLIKDGISSFSLELNKRMNVPISETVELAMECDDYYRKNGHWPDGHVTDFKIKK